MEYSERLRQRAAAVERAPEYPRLAQTGSARLDTLIDWWGGVGPSPTPQYRSISLNDAQTVDAAIDSGVTLISFAIPLDDLRDDRRDDRRDESRIRTMIGLFAGCDISDLLPSDRTDHEWMEQAQTIRDELFTLRDLRGDPIAVLEHLDMPDLTHRVDALLTCAARRTPCLVESLPDLAAALVADRLTHRAKTWWLACGSSTDTAVTAALKRLSLEPVFDLQLSATSSVGAPIIADLLTTFCAEPAR